MSKKSIHDCIKEYEKTAFTVSRSEAMQFAWNFCESQYKSEIEELKAKFSEATKTYTDDIDRLEKENDELKKKLDEAVGIIELVDYQFCTSFGDAENIRNSVNKAREFLKEVKGE